MSLLGSLLDPISILTYPTYNDFPISGSVYSLYIDASTNAIYRWTGSAYEEIGQYPQVETFADLPPAADNTAKIYFVKTGTGIWPLNKPAGFYYSNGTTWIQAPMTAGALTSADVIDNRISTDTNKPLSANQGKLNKDEIDLINNEFEERVDDEVAALIQTSSSIMWNYDDGVATLTGELIATGADKIQYSTGINTWDETDLSPYARANILDVANELAFQQSVNLEIGVDVQAYSSKLTDIAALTPTDGNIIVGNDTTWVAESGGTARASLELGTTDSPSFAGLTLSSLTAGSILFAGASGVITQDNTNFFWDDTNNRLGVLNNSPSYTAHLGSTSLTTNAELRLTSKASSILTLEADTDNITETDVAQINLTQDGGFVTANVGIDSDNYFYVNRGNIGGGGIKFKINNIDYLRFVANKLDMNGSLSVGAGYYGTIAPPTNGMAIEGKIGAGVSVVNARIHIGAGSATANTAPLKFTSGINLTTAEAGAIEYNGTNLFFTRTGTTRENIFTGNSGASAPSTAAGTPTTRYGGDTNYLGDPNGWASVVISGTTYKIPLYT